MSGRKIKRLEGQWPTTSGNKTKSGSSSRIKKRSQTPEIIRKSVSPTATLEESQAAERAREEISRIRRRQQEEDDEEGDDEGITRVTPSDPTDSLEEGEVENNPHGKANNSNPSTRVFETNENSVAIEKCFTQSDGHQIRVNPSMFYSDPTLYGMSQNASWKEFIDLPRGVARKNMGLPDVD